jgi:hypothetical protein
MSSRKPAFVLYALGVFYLLFLSALPAGHRLLLFGMLSMTLVPKLRRVPKESPGEREKLNLELLGWRRKSEQRSEQQAKAGIPNAQAERRREKL